MNDVMRHYDLLVAEGNDPARDPEELRAYMDGWDGETFLAQLGLDGTQDALEIGIGTGRLALRTAPLCRSLTGVDLSPMTIARARENLAGCGNVRLICADFLCWEAERRFDVVYSSLTLLHVADKRAAAERIASLLAPCGRAVLSLDKSRETVLDYGTRKLAVYPDDPEELASHLRAAGLTVLPAQETAFAHILTAVKGEER